MKILFIFYVLALMLGIIYIVEIFDIRNTHGEYIMKLRNKKGLLIFLIICLLFFINLLVLNIKNYIIFHKQGDFTQITLSLIWVIISLYHISKTYKYSEIREQGIYLERGFYDWSKIHCYEWMSPDTIKFKAHNSILGEYEEKVKIYCGDKEKIDEVLRKYIKQVFTSS